jgi:hypothetical protein
VQNPSDPYKNRPNIPEVLASLKDPIGLGCALYFIIIAAILTSAFIIYFLTHVLRLFV